MIEALMKNNVDELASLIPSGAQIVIAKNISGVPSELMRAVLRQEIADLHVVGVPTTGYAADLLIGAERVKTIETSAVTLDEIGLAPRFIEAVKQGSINLLDSTCPAVYSGLRASEKGIPFIPIRGLLGSDVLKYRADYQVIDNPYAKADPIVVVPAIRADFAVIHVKMIDQFGNVYFGPDRDMALMAHASEQTLVTAESVYEGNLLDDPLLAPATMSSIYVTAIAIAERGAWPLGLRDKYAPDYEHLKLYRRMAKTSSGFSEYLERYVSAEVQAVG